MDEIMSKIGFRKSSSRLRYFIVFSFMFVFTGQFNMVSGQAPAPLFEDPVYHAISDPAVVYNYGTGEWWMFYSQIRPDNPVFNPDVPWSWQWRCDIGIAKTTNGGGSWSYLGTANGLNALLDTAFDTHWMPAIVCENGTYHMYIFVLCSSDKEKIGIKHYTSNDLINWTLAPPGNLPSGPYSQYVAQLPDGTWRMWVSHHKSPEAWDSNDLINWTYQGEQNTINNHGDGTIVFVWKGFYWLILNAENGVNPGLTVWRSRDGSNNWTHKGTILATGGSRPHDKGAGRTGDVVVSGDEAYLFYYVMDDLDPNDRRSVVQVARLVYNDGAITCYRNAPFELKLGTP